MAQDPDVDELDDEQMPEKKGMKLPVLIGIILGIVIVQVGIVMAAIKFFAPQPAAAATAEHAPAHSEEKSEEQDPDEESGTFVTKKVDAIITTKSDIYINPRGSSKQIIILSLGIEITPEEKKEEVENKLMVPIQDLVISRFSNYTSEELQDKALRDSLRVMIKNELKPYFRGISEEGQEPVRLKNVYFPKFIIQ